MRWWRVFVDKLSGGKRNDVVGPRRRRAPRYKYAARVTAKCSSWPKFVQLFTGDVSDGGLYVPTDEHAEVGERVHVELTLPDGGTFTLTGTVVNVIDDATAARHGKRPGLGIQLDPLSRTNRQRFDQLLTLARNAAPIPAVLTTNGTPIPVPVVAEGSPQPPATATPARQTPKPTKLPPRRRPPPRATDGGPVVGIDMGTTYTSVAAIRGNKVSILDWPEGNKSTPSCIAFPSRGDVVVGYDARLRMATDPAHTVSSPKRLVGRQYDDIEIQSFIGQAPYRTLRGPNNSVLIELWGEQYTIVQLCSYVMKAARQVAEDHLEQAVERIVMTVPVSFDPDRAEWLKRAAEMAHLEVLALIDEPSAAALANRFDPGFGGMVGVYDFGGGTFDFSVVDVSRGDFRVLATAGDTWLGGDDFDTIVAEAAANQFWRQHKVDLRKQAVEWQKLVFACERAKRALSLADSTIITVPEVLRTARGMIDLNISIDRPTLERACSPVIERSLATCDEALALLDMKPTDLTTVYLSGGTTYIPAVRSALARHFGVPVRTGVPPEHAVCLGAAIHAAQLQLNSTRTLTER